MAEFQSKFISTEDLMELTAIDGDYNFPRVCAWQESAEAEIKNFTGFNIDAAGTDLENEKIKEFVSVAKIFIQERVREYFLAPNYEPRGIDGLKIRLSLIVDDMNEVDNGGETEN